MVNINLSKKPEWFLANTWGTVSVVRYNSNKDYGVPVIVNMTFTIITNVATASLLNVNIMV